MAEPKTMPQSGEPAVPRKYWWILGGVTLVLAAAVTLLVLYLTQRPVTLTPQTLTVDAAYTPVFGTFAQDRIPFSVETEDGKRYGFLTLDGEVVVEPVYEAVGAYHDGYAYATLDGKDGLLDLAGGVALDFIYDAVMGYEDGIAVVIRLDEEGAPYSQALNLQGEVLWEVDFQLDAFRDGMARYIDNETGLLGYVDTQGNIVLEAQYAGASVFQDGLAVVRTDGAEEASVINAQGEALFTTAELDETAVFSDGLFRVASASETGAGGDSVYDYVFYDAAGREALALPALHYLSDFVGNRALAVAPQADGGTQAYALERSGRHLLFSGEYDHLTYAEGVVFGQYEDAEGDPVYEYYDLRG